MFFVWPELLYKRGGDSLANCKKMRNEYMHTERILEELGGGDRIAFRNNKHSRVNRNSHFSAQLLDFG